MGKFVSVAFYFGGVVLAEFERKFGRPLAEVFEAEVQFVLDKGLMRYEGPPGAAKPTALQLTEEGVKAQNGVISLFYAPIDKAYLLSLPRLLKDSFTMSW
eukprot:TRINITY_DN5369_c0_g1_i11.p1 TRINITY_DN5369_c0_g1~~TRINITY_DN5369_c0_g1_i11.p1  ORF type:complete len:100 (+),score=35.98 TRINITY_DN5369_c0_g1_i11:95-394(+)